MNKKIYLTLALLASMCGQQAWSETLTIAQCREMAVRQNKEMAIATNKNTLAEYTRKMYRANYLPNFKLRAYDVFSNLDGHMSIPGGMLPVFNGGSLAGGMTGNAAYFPGVDINYKLGDYNMFGGAVTVEQPIYMGGKITSAYNLSKLGVNLAKSNEQLTREQVIVKVDEACTMVVKAQEMSKVANSYNDLLQELLRNVQSAYKHGLKPYNDVLKVQVKLNESELKKRQAANANRLAMMNLCHIVGLPLHTQVEIAESDLNVARPSDSNANITNRPEYQMLDYKVDMAKQEVQLKRSEHLPNVGVMAGYGYNNGIKVNDERTFDGTGFAAMLSVSVPLFHFGEGANKVKAAKAKMVEAELERDNLRESMLLEQSQAANNLDEAFLEDELTQKSLDQAQENLRLSKKNYEVGLETLADHLEAQTLWQQAYANYINAHYNLFLTHTRYMKAAGLMK